MISSAELMHAFNVIHGACSYVDSEWTEYARQNLVQTKALLMIQYGPKFEFLRKEWDKK